MSNDLCIAVSIVLDIEPVPVYLLSKSIIEISQVQQNQWRSLISPILQKHPR